MPRFIISAEDCIHTFGELLQEFRTRRKISQETLGGLIGGFSDATVSRWELQEALPDKAKVNEVINLIAEAIRCSEQEKEQLKHAYLCAIATTAGLI